MFAVFKTGNSQHKVHENDELKIEKVEGEVGQELEFDKILLLGSDNEVSKIGSPFVKGATITAEIVSQTKGEKVIVFKKQRRQNHRRKNGHRQELTEIKIKQIINK